MAKPRLEKKSDPKFASTIIGRPYTTNMGKTAHVRVRRVDKPEVTEIRKWSAHERVSVTRG